MQVRNIEDVIRLQMMEVIAFWLWYENVIVKMIIFNTYHHSIYSSFLSIVHYLGSLKLCEYFGQNGLHRLSFWTIFELFF